jgi:hypothetical protein
MAAERGSTIPPVQTRSGMRTVTPIWFESDRRKGANADAVARSMRDRAETCRRQGLSRRLDLVRGPRRHRIFVDDE